MDTNEIGPKTFAHLHRFGLPTDSPPLFFVRDLRTFVFSTSSLERTVEYTLDMVMEIIQTRMMTQFPDHMATVALVPWSRSLPPHPAPSPNPSSPCTTAHSWPRLLHLPLYHHHFHLPFPLGNSPDNNFPVPAKAPVPLPDPPPPQPTATLTNWLNTDKHISFERYCNVFRHVCQRSTSFSLNMSELLL